jgi:hypothetical protein
MIQLQYEQQRHVHERQQQQQQQQELQQQQLQQQQQQQTGGRSDDAPPPAPAPATPLQRPTAGSVLQPFHLPLSTSTDASAFSSSDTNFVGLGTLILNAPEQMLLLSRDDRRESSSTSLTGGEEGPADPNNDADNDNDEDSTQRHLHHNTERSAFGSSTIMYRSGGALQSLVTYGTLSSFRDAQQQLSEESMHHMLNDNNNSSSDNNSYNHHQRSPHRTPPPPSPTHHHNEFIHPPYAALPSDGEFVDLLSRKISNMEENRPGNSSNSSRSNSNNRNRNDHYCSQHRLTGLLPCLFAPFQRYLRIIWTNETLHRAFCYGAIDGMLTGAGIVSAFCGFNLLDTSTNATATNSPQIRALVVAFTAAACFADSVCMAVSHIWTTHVVATAQVAERAEARRQLQFSKAEVKGELVDMLLSKGMLTLDAKSLVDTLEGYPDMFVSILTGESLWGPALPTVQQQHGISTLSGSNSVASASADTHPPHLRSIQQRR